MFCLINFTAMTEIHGLELKLYWNGIVCCASFLSLSLVNWPISLNVVIESEIQQLYASCIVLALMTFQRFNYFVCVYCAEKVLNFASLFLFIKNTLLARRCLSVSRVLEQLFIGDVWLWFPPVLWYRACNVPCFVSPAYNAQFRRFHASG